MARNLPNWDAIAEDGVHTVLVIGESNAMAQAVTNAQCWPTLLDDASRWQSMGLGFRGMLRTTEWVSAGSPVRHTALNVYDKAPYRLGYRLNTSAMTWTYTVPAGFTAHSTSKIVYVDASGSGNWAISINGGAWQNIGAATTGDNVMKGVAIGTTVAAGGTIAVRGANAAGTAAQCDLVGIDLRNGNTTGIIVHNAAVSAHKLGGPLVATIEPFVHDTVGDDLAILDYIDPDLCIIWHESDAIYEDITELRSSIQEVITRVQGNGGDLLLPGYPELENLNGFTEANQAAMRAAYAAEAVENNCAQVDVFHEFGGTNAAGIANGYFQGGGDNTHFSTTGHQLVANRIWRVLGRTPVLVQG